MAKDLKVNIKINGQDNTGQAFGKTRAGIQSISQQLAGLQTRLQQFIALRVGDIIARQLGKLVETADGYKTLQARLKLVSDTTEEYNIAQRAVFDIAQRTRGDLDATAGVYGKLETAVKQLGGTQQDALGVTETLNQAIALTSQGASQDSAAILQFSQALGSGVLRGDEFNSVMENSPGLAKALADGLGVPITALRGMAEAGELTADRLINALGKAAPAVSNQFAQLPVTVGQAFTRLNNEFTRYIGEADAAGGVTAKLAAIIQFAAENIKPLAKTALTLAGVYGVTLLQGLVKSGAAMLDNAAASRAQAIAQQTAQAAAIETLQTEVQVARVRAITTKQLIEEARLQQALATSDKQRALAIKQLEKAMLDYHNAINLVNGKQAALATATTATATAMTLAQRAALLLNNALSLLVAFEIGKTIGEWLNQFTLFQSIGVRVAEVFTIIKTGADGLFSGISFADRVEEIKRIHAEYNVLADSVGKAAAAQETNINAGDDAAKNMQRQAESSKSLTDSYKALADAAKDAADQQLAGVDTQQTQAVRTIETTVTDAGGVDRSRERERQITQVLLDANRERSRINQAASDERLRLIDQAHTQEVAAAQKANQSTAELDKKWLDSKFKVLQDWRGSSQKTVDELIALEKKHRDAAIQADTDIANHKRSTQDLIKQLQGKTEVNSAADLSRLQGDTVLQKRNINDALKTGDTAKALQEAKRVEQSYIDIAQKAKGLFDQGLIDQSAFDITIFDLQQAAKQVDDITAQQGAQEQQAAEQLTAEIANQQATLADVNGQMDAVIEKAKQLITINVDAKAIDAAKAAIDAIPSEKTVTIKTVNQAGQPVADKASVPGFANGTRLGGFGGGDQIPALLEPGEGVVNKFGMRALDGAFGPGFFDGVNAGADPIAMLRRNMQTLKLSEGGRLSVNLPSLDISKLAGGPSGTPVNIHLPNGQKFGPFNGDNDMAAALADALHREALVRGRRGK